MKKEYTWEIKVNNTPTLRRKCNRCDCNSFYCSNKFRMNAQKRNLDVWLIYRCVACDSTYNLTILSRTKPEQIEKKLFRKFSENDEELAWKYAFSAETGQKNGVELNYNSVEYEILHDPVSVNELLNSEEDVITFRIRASFEFGLKMTTVIRSCLGLSANQLNRIIESKAIFIPGDYPVKKHKIKDGDRIQVDKKQLSKVFRAG